MRFPVSGEQRRGQPPRPDVSLEPAAGDSMMDSMLNELMEELR